VPLTPDQAEILLSADEGNLAAKVKAGKTLTLGERARLESIRAITSLSPVRGALGGEGQGEGVPAYVTKKADVARLLGLSRQKLQFHTRRPDFPKRSDSGQYRTADVLAYARRAGLISLSPTGGEGRGEGARQSTDLDLYTERARLAKEQADRAAIENARLRQELLETEAVLAAWSIITSSIRQKALSLPPKIESQCNLPPEARARLRKILDREIDDLLTELATPPNYQIIEDAGDAVATESAD
jgi:hypothetical protein